MKGFIVYPSYVIEDNKAIVTLYGRLENNESFLAKIPQRPYFYILESDLDVAKETADFEFEKTEMKSVTEKKLVKVLVNIPEEVKNLRKKLEENGITCFEADIRFAYRYLMDMNLKSSLKIEGKYEKGERVDRIYQNPKITSTDYTPKNLKILSFDIEAHHKNSDLYAISLYSDDYEKKVSEVFLIGKSKKAKCFDNEKDLLVSFKERIVELDPDVIIGWNVIDFDLDYLKKKYQEHKIKFDIGRNNSEIKLNIQSQFFRDSSANINGRIVLDGIHVLKGSFVKLPDYRLDTAAEKFLGERKIITETKAAKYDEINRLFKEDQDKLVEYNLKDSILAYNILRKSGTFALTVQRSLLTGMPMDRVNSSIASLDQVYIPAMNKLGYAAQTKAFSRKDAGLAGGFVMSSKPGIYDYVLVLDFKSLYPSIIRTFNVDPISFLGMNVKKDNVVTAPNGATFKNTEGILPTIIADLMKERERAKKEKNIAESNAIKLLMNSFWGVLASPMCRFFSYDMASGITAFARFLTKKTAEVIRKEGYEVIYGDSVSKDSQVIIQKNQKLEYISIEKLFKKVDKKSGNKEYNFLKGTKTLTIDDNGNSVFKPIKYVMRHKLSKKMYRVHFTNYWYVDVTEDHSLIGYINKSKNNRLNTMQRLTEVKPTEIGTKIKSVISLKKIPNKKNNSKNYPIEVYEFLGFFIGDGSFQKNNYQKEDYYLGLSLGKDKKEAFSKIIKPLINKGYINNYWWSKSRDGDIKFNGMKLMSIVTDNFRSEDGKKIIPEWMLFEKQENIGAFLRGLFSADGTVMLKNNSPIIKYTSTSEEYINIVRKLLYLTGVSNTVFEDKSINQYKTHSTLSKSKNIIVKDKEAFVKNIGFLLNRKNTRAKIKSAGLRNRSFKALDFDIQSVKKIEEINYDDYVYDLEVEKTHRFFANNILVHNTDSVFVNIQAKNNDEAQKIGKEIEKYANDFYTEFIKKEYKRNSTLELEFEKTFIRFWMPRIRGSEEGSKKRYAGLIIKDGKETIDFTGLEFVRRDWTGLAKEFQLGLLEKVFHKKPVEKFVADFVKDVKSGKKDELLVYRKAIRKDLASYTKTTPPHVKAARKLKNGMQDLDDNIIEYYITTDGPEPIQNLSHKIDYDHYIEKQVKPLADSILEEFNTSFEEVLGGAKQTTLGSF